MTEEVIQDRATAVPRFVALGWIESARESKMVKAPRADLEPVVLGYQAFHGLDVTGDLDDTTLRHMNAPRFCGHPDIMRMAEAQTCAWSNNRVSWGLGFSSIGGLSGQVLHDAFSQAMQFWADVSGLQPYHDGTTPNIYATAGRIDGPSGTLAWSELPCGNVRQLKQKYDTSERWLIAERPQGGLDIVRVIAHELGHALGIPHIRSGNLMQPMYSTSIRRPQSGDIAEIRRRHGEPTTPVPPDGGGDGGGDTGGGSDCGSILREILKTENGKRLARQALLALLKAFRTS